MRSDVIVDLQPHQRLMCDFLKTHPACGLFLPMGFGKTVTVLEGIYELDPPGHVLVIGPKPVIRSTWSGEIEKFGFPFRIDSLVINEKGKQRKPAERHQLYQDIATGKVPPKMWFLNREMVTDLVNHLPKQGKATIWPFPTVVLDEAQAFKSYKSKRYEALMKMRPAMSRIIELSGTPTPNGMEDLYPLVRLLDGGLRLGDCITRYREKYFYPDPYIRTPQGYPAKWHLQAGADKLIYNAVSDIVVSMQQVASLMPPITIDIVELDMTKSEWKLYRKMAKEQVLTFDDGSEAIASNAAVLQAKLLQMASGALYINESNDEWETIHTHKLEATADIIRCAGSPVLVAYWFKSDKSMLMQYLTEEGFAPVLFDGTPEMVNRWNAKQIPVMLVQPASAGHGLNLQAGGHTLIWYTMPWSLEAYLQTNARLHRQGQTNPVMVHILSMNGTVDEKVSAAIAQKNFDQSAFLDAIRFARNVIVS